MILKRIFFIVFFLLSIPKFNFSQATDLLPLNLKTEYKDNPVTDELQPRLSWELRSAIRGQEQTAYQVIVASSPRLLNDRSADLWNTGKLKTNETNQIVYNGKTLKPRTICYWKVRAWDKNGIPGGWSAMATWEIGLVNKSNWSADWIGNDLNSMGKGKDYDLPPAPFFRKEINLLGGIKKARLYVTALGLYEFYINGKKIGADHFTPGWTDYNKRVYYQVYDVTKNITPGKNAIGSIVADGWYAGYLGYALLVGNPVVKHFYGNVPLLKAMIEVEYTNGRKQIIGTDKTWKTSHGPLVQADILNGETYDARLEFDGWNKPGFADKNWKNAELYPDKEDRVMTVYPGNPVRVYQYLNAVNVTPQKDGKYIFNLGQNFAGNVRLRVRGKAGDSIVLRYGEMLFPDGRLMTENLRKARATDTYILKGDPQGETYIPRFTYHGFQYVEVTGLREKPDPGAITGVVLGSATPVTGDFVTDNPMVNQLYHNIVWSQRSNYFEVPTDCPQRDERLGWTGDAQTYVQSATFNNNIAAFFTKWEVDLNDAQRPDQTFPIYAPAPNVRATDTYSPGWSEAGIICPYTIYKAYGDTRIILRSWPNMTAYMDFLEKKSSQTYLFKEGSFEDISPKGGFGDWLSVGKKTPPDMLATMYYAYVASMMSEMAQAIGRFEDQKKYAIVFDKIKTAFRQHYVDSTGRFKTNEPAYGDGKGYVDGEMGFVGHTQTAYANAIYMNILQPEAQQKAGNWLTELINSNGGKLSTGFLGVRPLLPALSATGHGAEAYKLLLSTAYPSWGYEVINGANTVWERWNSYVKGEGFTNNAGMNSFNHYAFGSVNEWLFGNAAGIKVVQPGFRTFIIKPEIASSGINYVKATYQSISGQIISSWQRKGKRLELNITIPVNTKAELYIPTSTKNGVFVNKKPLVELPWIKVKGQKNGYLVVEVGSGNHSFQSVL